MTEDSKEEITRTIVWTEGEPPEPGEYYCCIKPVLDPFVEEVWYDSGRYWYQDGVVEGSGKILCWTTNLLSTIPQRFLDKHN